MKKFSDLGIKPAVQGFTGDKIKVDRILNREITVFDFKIEDSKYTKKCLHMQIELNGTKHVVFSGSSVLMDMIQKVNKADFPFTTTIVRESERLEFT